MKYKIKYWVSNWSKEVGYEDDQIINQKQFINLLKKKPFTKRYKIDIVHLQYLLCPINEENEFDFYLFIDDRMFKTR